MECYEKKVLWEIKNLEDFKQNYSNKIWNRGIRLYAEGGIQDAFATDENTACFTVKGTIDYTVMIQKKEESVHIECNCSYLGSCKHEVAALYYLKEHPKLNVVNQSIKLEINELDSFKLEVEEHLYEMECEDDYDDTSFEERLKMLYQKIIDEKDDNIKMLMIMYLWEKFPTDEEIWEHLVEVFKQNSKAVKQAITNIKATYMSCMIEEAIKAIEINNQEHCKDLICCLKEKLKQL